MQGRLGQLRAMLSGDRTAARSVRSTALTFAGFGGNMLLRFGSNLILTRLLMPEAFGLMALVQLVIIGMQMFSDVGLNDAIIRSRRGEDPVFLNTAWSVTILRGLVLWLAVVLLAGPIAVFYDDPRLASLLPVAGISLVFGGLVTTRTALAWRNLVVGRLTALELAAQATGIAVMIVLALLTGSIWALVAGAIVSEAMRAALSHLVLPGAPSRLQWDWPAFWELFSFGKFVFVTSILGFVVANSDRAILGKFVSLTDLAVFNIGFMLASVPLMLTRRVTDRVLVSLYSQAAREGSPDFLHKLQRGRFLLTIGIIGSAVALGLVGDWLITTLYTEPYHLAGPVLVLLCVANLPLLALLYYKAVYFGAGRPQDYMVQYAVLAVVQVTLLYVGIRDYGLLGAMFAPGLSAVLIYPLTAWLAARQGGWDWKRDAAFFALIVVSGSALVWLHWDAVLALMPDL